MKQRREEPQQNDIIIFGLILNPSYLSHTITSWLLVWVLEGSPPPITLLDQFDLTCERVKNNFWLQVI